MADYVASEGALVAEREERLKEMMGIGLGEEFAGCPEGFVESVVGFLEEGWGGVRGYLEGIGVDGEMMEGVRGNLMVGEGRAER